MRIYHFSEEPYPDAWGAERPSLRITLPNEICDPDVAHRLYNRYIDEWMLADELGFDIMLNEHHSTATCLTASASVILSSLARVTKRARLLVLGVPIGNRPDPIRVAEEMSMIDVISKGRLEFGMIKGVPYDIEPANSNAVSLMSRFWEAHDLAESTLDDCPGVSESRKQALLRKFGSVARLRRTSAEAIAKVPGIGAKLAETIAQFLKERG